MIHPALSLCIPYPPTGNTATRHAGGRHYVNKTVKRYRMEVASIIAQMDCKTLFGPLSVVAEVYPPDNRRRDLDNAWKSAGDALTKAGVWIDDHQIVDLRLIRGEPRERGQLVVTVEEAHIRAKDDLPAAAERLAEDFSRWPSQLAEMTWIIQDELARALPGLSPAEVRRAACRQVCRFIDEYGGTRPYIPKSDVIRRALRDLSIWGEHDGTVDGPHGIRALAAKYDLSEVAVWSVLRQQRNLHRQPSPAKSG